MVVAIEWNATLKSPIQFACKESEKLIPFNTKEDTFI